MIDENTVIEIPLNRRLVQARTAKHLSQEDVCSQLNLSPAQLNKLESDLLVPAELTFFERGYIRNYAAYLEMDKAEYECFFPQFSELDNQLHSVRRFSVPIDKPLFGNLFGSLFIKLILILVIIFVVGFLVKILLPSDTQTDSLPKQVENQLGAPGLIEKIKQMELP